jgi:4-amino-4-deoxy-L-arabinose transferase-like glycosyltransferase
MTTTTTKPSAHASTADPPGRALLTLVILLLLAGWFGTLGLRALFIPDEGRYAEIPREMLATGDWVTPRLNDLKYFEKPPLQYWLTALSFRVFGESEWTARLPSALLGFLALLMVGYCGHRLWNRRTGVLAVAILGSACAYYLGGQYLTLDMTLTACLTLALCSFLLAQVQAVDRHRQAWMAGAWAAAALAVLAKGLVGVVLPAMSFLAYIALCRDTRLWARLNPVVGMLVFLLIAAPWFVVVQLRNPEFFEFFFIREHFQRFAEAGHHRPGPWWYYLPIVVVGMMPWTPTLAVECVRQWKARPTRGGAFSPAWFCAVWTGVIVVFFSVSHSKLPAYILPAFPAIALLLARRLADNGTDSIRWSAVTAVASGLALTVAIGLLPGWRKFAVLGERLTLELPWLYVAAAALTLTGIGAVLWTRRRQIESAVAALIAGALVSWGLVFGYLHAVDDEFSSQRLVHGMTKERVPFHPEAPFYSVGQFDHSVPFYLRRAVTLVDYRGELGPGIDLEPHKYVPTIDEFADRWMAEGHQAFAILERDTLGRLQQRGLPMTEVAANRRLVIVARRAFSP